MKKCEPKNASHLKHIFNISIIPHFSSIFKAFQVFS